MALEPTSAQLEAIRDSIPAGYNLPLSLHRASKLFELVRDIALGAAAQECERIADSFDDRHDPEAFSNGAGACKQAIRAMMGPPFSPPV